MPYNSLPDSPGVYLMKNKKNQIIYIGKASSLKKRVNSYFTNARNAKTEKLISKISKIDYKKTGSILEATILEANLIKEKQPKYNIKQKDDKSFLYIVVTKDDFPKILIKRGREKSKNPNLYQAVFGPFTNQKTVRSVLKLSRKIFPYSTCEPPKNNVVKKPCFYYQIKKCPGVCIGAISKKDYNKIIKNFILFFQGRKKQIIQNFKKEMQALSKKQKFEKAAKLKNQLISLNYINDISLMQKDQTLKLISFPKIEGYDVSNISGQTATGSMVVFQNNQPNKKKYRRFKIKNKQAKNDTKMLKEVLQRRFQHKKWIKPDLILVDGGKAQVNAALAVFRKNKLKIPVVGIAKGQKRKKNKLIFGPMIKKSRQKIQKNKNLLIQVRNEAHRFAIKYHRKLRKIDF